MSDDKPAMTGNVKLAPCPFCGTPDPIIVVWQYGGQVQCRKCGCSVICGRVNTVMDSAEAERQWNTRALPAGGGGDDAPWKPGDIAIAKDHYGRQLIRGNEYVVSAVHYQLSANATYLLVIDAERNVAQLLESMFEKKRTAPSDAAGMREALTAARKYIATMAEVDRAHDDFALLAQIDAALAQPQGGGWLPMDDPALEAVKKDGTKILARWKLGLAEWGPIIEVRWLDSGLSPSVWAPSIGASYYAPDAFNVWMPLPSAPQTEERE